MMYRAQNIADLTFDAPNEKLGNELLGCWKTAPEFPNDPDNPVNDRQPLFDDRFTDESLVAHIRRHSQENGNRTAIDDGIRTINYQELIQDADRLAKLLTHKTKENEAIGLCLLPSVELQIAMIACLAAGRPYIVIDLTNTRQRNETIIIRSGLKTLLTSRDAFQDVSLFNQVSEIIVINDDCEETHDWEFQSPLPDIDTDRPALILYTSGSTGEPKGIVNHQRAILERARQYIHSARFNSDDVFLPLGSPSTIAGTREWFTALAIGAKLIIATPERLGINGLRARIAEARVTVINGVPALFRVLMAKDTLNPPDFNSVRFVKLGGDKILADDLALIKHACPDGARIQVGYSSTETTGTYGEAGPHIFNSDTNRVFSGYLHSSIKYKIIPQDSQPLGDFAEGELVIQSPFVALGYWIDGHIENGEISNQPDTKDERIFRTGDIVRIYQSGGIEIIGRKDRQIKVNGRRVEPAELELFLRRLADVTDAAIIAPLTQGRHELVAFVTIRIGIFNSETISTIRQKLRQEMPPSMHPVRLHVIDSILRLPSGKQDNSELALLDQKCRESEYKTEPKNFELFQDAQNTAARLWKSVLGKNFRDNEQAWDEAGGDSLSLLNFVFQLESATGKALDLSKFRLDMTLNDVVKNLSVSGYSSYRNHFQYNRPTVFLLPGLTGNSPSLSSVSMDLKDVASIETVNYPSWREMAAGADRLEDMIEATFSCIAQKAPHGPVHLIGYSLGGTVAYAVAERLMAAGKNIGLFCILDNTIYRPSKKRSMASVMLSKLLHIMRSTHRQSISEKIVELAGLLITHQRFTDILALLARSDFKRIPLELRFKLRNSVWEALQTRALELWIKGRGSKKLPIHALLVVSDERRYEAPDDLGWGRHIERLEIHRTSGDHHTMLREPHRRDLVKKLSQAINVAVTNYQSRA